MKVSHAWHCSWLWTRKAQITCKKRRRLASGWPCTGRVANSPLCCSYSVQRVYICLGYLENQTSGNTTRGRQQLVQYSMLPQSSEDISVFVSTSVISSLRTPAIF
jgi:hypothetical protein